MQKITKVLVLSMAMMLSSYALAATPQPAHCPSPTALQSSVFLAGEQDEEGVWDVGSVNNTYDTLEEWTFLIRNIFANGNQDALNRAYKALKTVIYKSGPDYLEDFNMWVCDYTTTEGYVGVAITPPLEIGSKLKLR